MPKKKDYCIDTDLMNRIIKYIQRYDCNMSYGLDCHYGDFMLIADWNKNKLKSLDNWLNGQYYEHAQIQLGYDDEYQYCDNCMGLICTTAQYHGDTGRFMYGDGEIFCSNCIKDDPDLILDYYLNNSSMAIPDYLTEHIKNDGFICFSTDESGDYCPIYESGLHIGQDDNPKDIEKKILELKYNYDYLFMINSVGQFDVKWSVFIRRIE